MTTKSDTYNESMNILNSAKRQMKGMSYEQLLESAKSTNNKIVSLYIPPLCESLKRECPEWSRRMIQNKICNVLEEYGIENPGGYYGDVIIEATKHYRTSTMYPQDREKRSEAQRRRHAADYWKKAHVCDTDKGTWK